MEALFTLHLTLRCGPSPFGASCLVTVIPGSGPPFCASCLVTAGAGFFSDAGSGKLKMLQMSTKRASLLRKKTVRFEGFLALWNMMMVGFFKQKMTKKHDVLVFKP